MGRRTTSGHLGGRLLTGLGAGVLIAVLGAAPAMAMAVYVDLPDGHRITLDSEPSDSIENVRAQVQDREGIPPELQSLFWQDRYLEDGRTLSDYNIQRNSVLQLVRRYPSSAAVSVDVATPAGSLIALDVEVGDSVEALRQKIMDRIGAAVADQVLTFGGRILVDGRAIGDYGITGGSTVTLELPAPVWADGTLAAPQFGVPYSDGVAITASGLVTVYSVSAGALPAGLTLDSATGAITGTATAGTPSSFTIRAANAAGVLDQAFVFTGDPSAAQPGATTTPGTASAAPSGTTAATSAPHLAETGAAADQVAPLLAVLALVGAAAVVGDRMRRRPERG